MVFRISENLVIDIEKTVMKNKKEIIVRISSIKKDDTEIYKNIKGKVVTTTSGNLVIKLPDEKLINITENQDVIDYICNQKRQAVTLNPIRLYTSWYKNSNNVKKKRVECGLSQLELEKLSGLTERSLYKIEKYGIEKSSISNAYALAKFFKCDIEDLLDEEV